eukprot:9323767-Alexandrium_andersonii.AAC.1
MGPCRHAAAAEGVGNHGQHRPRPFGARAGRVLHSERGGPPPGETAQTWPEGLHSRVTGRS